LAFSPNDKFLAATGSDFSLKVWDLADNRLAFTREGETNIITSFNQPVFSPDSQNLVAPMLGEVMVIDTNSWTPARAIFKNRDVWSVAFSPNGEQLAAGFGWGDRDLEIIEWSSESPAFSLSLDGSVSKIAYSAGGGILAAMLHTCGVCPPRKDTGLRVWKLEGNQLFFEKSGFGMEDMALSPDGSLLAYVRENDKEIQIVNLATGEELPSLEKHQNTIKQIAFSHNGKTLASGDLDGTLILWDTNEWNAQLTVPGHDAILALSFSNNDSRLALGGKGSVELWDVPREN
jgi:WD40 repeat protein